MATDRELLQQLIIGQKAVIEGQHAIVVELRRLNAFLGQSPMLNAAGSAALASTAMGNAEARSEALLSQAKPTLGLHGRLELKAGAGVDPLGRVIAAAERIEKTGPRERKPGRGL